MKTHEIFIDSNVVNPKSLADILAKNKIAEGDKLIIKKATISDEAFITVCILVVSVIALWFANENKKTYTDKLLADIFRDRTLKDIEEEMLKSYGITVEIESKAEKDLWLENAKHNLSKAYGEEEPDYESMILKEPNPDYSK
jgi:dsDNA-binding SOS-regulon protein